MLEAEIIRIAKEYNIALLGPNCLGFINPSQYLNASFASSLPISGSVAFFSQSGALTSAFLDLTQNRLGFSLFASIGNKAVIDEKSLFEHLFKDEGTKTIGFYTENISDAPRFIALGRENLRSNRPKPMVALKSGTTAAGTNASSSHTGAVAGSDAAYDALFRQAGIFRAESFQELMDALLVLDSNPLPDGNRVAIVTNAGGLGVLATDAAIKNGLVLATLDEQTTSALKSFLPPAANTHNPIDVLGDALATRYEQALNIIADDEGVDALLIILTPQTMTEAEATAEAIVRLRKAHPELPIVTVFSGDQLVAKGHSALQKGQVPNLLYPENAARALGELARFAEMKRTFREESPAQFEIDTEKAQRILAEARAQGEYSLGEYPAAEFLKCAGFPYLKSALVTSADEAAAFAETLGFPVALKIASPDIIHKSDVGGVLLDVAPEFAREAFDHLMLTIKTNAATARIEGATIAEMAQTGGRELLLGLKKEPGLGTLVVVGIGGIYVEVFKDVAMRFAPLLPSDIDAMLGELKSLPLLMGARGTEPIDLAQLKEYIARLSQLAVEFPEIEELDINPLLAFPDKAAFRILDSRLRIAEKK
ncbi:MAG: acetate--CoA ligase family protein, partial [Undibacterium sp.]